MCLDGPQQQQAQARLGPAPTPPPQLPALLGCDDSFPCSPLTYSHPQGYEQGEDLLEYDEAALREVCEHAGMKPGHATRFRSMMKKALGLQSGLA